MGFGRCPPSRGGVVLGGTRGRPPPPAWALRRARAWRGQTLARGPPRRRRRASRSVYRRPRAGAPGGTLVIAGAVRRGAAPPRGPCESGRSSQTRGVAGFGGALGPQKQPAGRLPGGGRFVGLGPRVLF